MLIYHSFNLDLNLDLVSLKALSPTSIICRTMMMTSMTILSKYIVMTKTELLIDRQCVDAQKVTKHQRKSEHSQKSRAWATPTSVSFGISGKVRTVECTSRAISVYQEVCVCVCLCGETGHALRP